VWQEEEFEQICSRELLTEKAAEIGKTIAVKERERERYDFDPIMFYENRFWNRKPDGILINKNQRILYILEFKRSSNSRQKKCCLLESKWPSGRSSMISCNEDFRRVKEVIKPYL